MVERLLCKQEVRGSIPLGSTISASYIIRVDFRSATVAVVSDTVQGPQSYFPSIEKKYGHPVAHWFEILASHADKPHMGMVEILKNQHGQGHGHANALVAHFRAVSG